MSIREIVKGGDDDFLYQKFTEEFIEYCTTHFKSMHEAAESFDLSNSTIYKLIQGKRPTSRTLRYLKRTITLPVFESLEPQDANFQKMRLYPREVQIVQQLHILKRYNKKEYKRVMTEIEKILNLEDV